jgi:hypothetical protein
MESRKHIDEDVKPYVCLSEDCTSPLLFFVHMDEWLRHMKTIHSDQWNRKIHMHSWYCETDHDRFDFDDYASFAGHMKDPDKHMRPPPTELQLDALSRKNQQLFIREDEYCCPLCDCVPDSLKPIIQTGNFDRDEVRNSLWKHIAKHIKILAFILVPNWTGTSPSQIVSEAEFDQQSGRRLRGENSAASNPSRVDSEINAVTLSFIDEPQQLFESISEHEVYIITDTRDSHWNDIGFDDYKLRHTSTEQHDPILAHFAHLQKEDTVSSLPKLGRTIRSALRTSSWEKEGRKFLPIDELERIINMEAIQRELLRNGKDASLAQKVWGTKGSKSEMTTRRKIFAILVMVDNVPAITNFIDGGIFDSHLPFLFRDGTGERAGTLDVYRKLKGREGVPDREIEIEFFQEWEDVKLITFENSQWQVLAPYFCLVSKDNKVVHYNLDDRSVLPFIEDQKVDEPLAQHGGSADVRRVKIHYSHQNIRIVSSDLYIFTSSVKKITGADIYPRPTTLTILRMRSNDFIRLTIMTSSGKWIS